MLRVTYVVMALELSCMPFSSRGAFNWWRNYNKH